MRGKPSNIDEFRNPGGERAAPAPVAQAPAAAPVAEPAARAAAVAREPSAPAERRNKTIRIRKDFETRLKDEAYERSRKRGATVAESDLIDEALAEWFAKLDEAK